MTASRPTCRVHGVPLLPGHTRIVYGYPAPREPGGPEEAEEREFPSARTRILGGCIVSPDNARVDEVLYCPACRAGLARWTADWETRRDAERRERRRRRTDGDPAADG